MNLRSRLWLVLPLLFAVYPIAAQLSANISEVKPADATRSLLVSILLAYAILGMVWLANGRDGDRAALATVGILIVFFAYGHLHLLTAHLRLAGVLIGRHRHLIPLVLTALLAWLWLVLRRLPEPYRLTPVLLCVGLVVLIAPANVIASSLVAEASHNPSLELAPLPPGEATRLTLQTPRDIFFIVLDGYARADVLEEVYGFDNREFVDALEARGFYVADKSHSNYNRTALSLSSTLNYEYLPDLLGRELTKGDEDLVRELIGHSRMRSQLEELGYETVAFNNGYQPTRIEDADRYITFPEQGDRFNAEAVPFVLNPLEGSLISTTAFTVLEETIPALNLQRVHGVNYEDHRTKVIGILQTLQEIPLWQGEFFVIAHVISPHPPFVFAADGSPVNPDRPFTFADADDFLDVATSEEYLERYPEQVAHLNNLVLEAVDRILQDSTVPPIIVIEGDHGSRRSMVFNSVEKTNLKETFSNLNAYYLPEGGTQDLYPSITPVNTFRVILNRYFGATLPLLSDRSYFAERPATDIYDVTGFE